MRVTGVRIDLSGIERRFSPQRMQAAQMLLAERVGRDSNVHAPYRTGTLHASMGIREGKVVWPVDYAIYPYKGHVTGSSADGKDNAHSEWFEFAKRTYFSSWLKTVEAALR